MYAIRSYYALALRRHDGGQGLRDDHVHGRRAATAIGDGELDLGAVAGRGDARGQRGGVQKHLTAVITGDEAESLVGVKESYNFV